MDCRNCKSKLGDHEASDGVHHNPAVCINHLHDELKNYSAMITEQIDMNEKKISAIMRDMRQNAKDFYEKEMK